MYEMPRPIRAVRRRPVAGLLFALSVAFAAFPVSAAGKSQAPAMKLAAPIKIYHIEGRRSDRIIWLCEELGLPYQLQYRRGDLAGSMDLIRSVNPLVPMAPTVDIAGQILVESGGILEIIDRRYGGDRLSPAISSPDFPAYMQWLHFAEGTVGARMAAEFMITIAAGKDKIMSAKPGQKGGLVGSLSSFAFMEKFLGEHPYFGGAQFSNADIMMMFPVRAAKQMVGLDPDTYPNIAAWRQRVETRPAYKRAMAAALPDGKMPDAPAPPPSK